MDELINSTEYNETFESIKHIDELGNEYWYARELQKVLNYSRWENFEKVINKGIIALKGGKKVWVPDVKKPKNVIISDYIKEVKKSTKTGKGKIENKKDYKLSRYICYLIVQNADSRKPVIAFAQQYFAIQTRKQEISEIEYNELSETDKRLYIRNQTKKGNYTLNQTAKNAGVKNFDKFHNAGYKGLYNGETANDIAKRKNLRYREDILDNMGSEELASNLFRIVQTESKIKNENIKGEINANEAHFNVGKIVRNAIEKSGGTMPEKLPTPNKSLKQIEKENKRDLVKK